MRPALRCCLLLCFACLDTARADTASRPPPIRPVTDCIDPDRVQGWRALDTHRIVVVQGERHYLVATRARCTALARTMGLRLSTHSYGRVCGDTGEVIEVDGTRCAIDRVQRLSAEEYEVLRRQRTEAARGSD